MKILFLHSPLSEGLTGSLYHSAVALGAQCEYFDLVEATAAEETRFKSPFTRRLLRPIVWDGICTRLLDQFAGKQFDLILQVKGIEYSPRALRALKDRTGALLFNYYPDSPFCRSSSSRRLIRAIPITDIFFTFTEEFVAPLLEMGSPCVKVLPFARDDALHRPVTLTQEERSEIDCDVSFVGSWSRDREYWLSQVSDLRLGIWGPPSSKGWTGRLKSCFRGGPVDAATTTRILSGSRITVNVVRNWDDLSDVPVESRPSNYWGTGHNMRSFEALACGAFLLSSRTANLERLFREGVEVEYFSSAEEMKQKVDYYFRHPEERSRIAMNGHRRVQAETYQHRVLEILQAYDSLRCGRSE